LNEGFTLWLTGNPGTGKAALAKTIHERMIKQGHKVELLDDRHFRDEYVPELENSTQGYNTSAKVFAAFCTILNRNDIDCVVSAVSPSAEIRQEFKDKLENMVEIQISDKVKGNIDYNASQDPDLVLHMNEKDPDSAIEEIFSLLEELTFVQPTLSEYSDEEKEEIDARLKSLGYM